MAEKNIARLADEAGAQVAERIAIYCRDRESGLESRLSGDVDGGRGVPWGSPGPPARTRRGQVPPTQIEKSTACHEDGVEFGGGRLAYATGDATVVEAMVHGPKLLPATATGGDVSALFSDDHILAALVVDDEDRLLTVVEPSDLAPSGNRDRPAKTMGTLRGRTVAQDADLWETWKRMTGDGHRRLAVVEDGRCVGLLCLKSSGRGFCCDAGIRARALGR